MFYDASGTDFKKVVIACGYTGGRLGINGLTSLISLHYKLDPYEKGILFLFCGRRKDRCKAILWEGDGFLLLTKRLSNGRFCWPANEEELRQLSPKAIGSENGAAAAACAYSIAETAKSNQADPFYYNFLSERLPSLLKEHGLEEDLRYLDCLMPWTEGYRCYEQSEKERYRRECLVSV